MPYIGNNHIAGDHTNNFKVLDNISSYTATFDGSASSVVDTTNNTIRVVEHRFIQGQRVTYTNGGGGNIGGLTTGTAYFVIFDSASTIKLATNASNAANSTAINLSAVGTGSSHTLNAAFDGVNKKFKLTHGSGTGARLNNATQINVAINNVVQRPNLDPNNFTDGFALEDNHKIVFQTAPTSEDIFWGSIIANTLTTFDISDHKIDTFTGDGSTTEFTLSHTPANNESLMVTINGVLQHPSNASTARAYTLIASIIQFTAAPGVGDEIQVRHLGFAGATTADVSGFYGRTGNVVLGSTDHITTGDITARNINASGILTASSASFGGNVSIGGTLTYEDVSNIDSVGIITARDGIDCNGDIDVDGHTNLDNVSVAGVTTFSDSDIFFKNSGITSCKFDSNIGQFYFNNSGGLSWYKNGNLSSSSGAMIFYSEFANQYKGLVIQAPWQGQNNAKNITVMGSSNGRFVIQSNLNASETFRANFEGGVNLGYYQSGTKLSTTQTGITLYQDLTVNRNALITGISTFTGNIDANGDLDVDGHTNLDNVSIAGVTTSTGNIYADNYFANSGLTLNNNGNPSVNITSTSTTGSSRIHFGDPDSTSVGKIYYVHNGDYMQFSTAYNERLRIESDGNVRVSDQHLRFDTSGKGIIFGNHGGSNRPSIIGNYTSSSDNYMVFNVTGEERLRITSDGYVQMNADAKFLQIGAGQDLDLHHNGTNSYIRNKTGDLHIRPLVNEEGIILKPNGSVELYHDNTKRLETTSSGVEIPQALFVGEKIDMPDHTSGTNGMILLGTGDDLYMYHDGTNSHLRNNTGTFNVRATNFRLTDAAIQHVYLKTNNSGNNDVQLYYDNSVRLETTSSGVQITNAGGVPGLTVKGTGSNRADVRILATGTGNANLYLDASNGDLSGADYAVLQHKNDLNLALVNYAEDIEMYVRNGTLGLGGLEKCFHAHADGAVELYHNGSKKLETSSSGITVSGSITATSNLTCTNQIYLNGNAPQIVFTDTNQDSDYTIKNDFGSLQFIDRTNSNAVRLYANTGGFGGDRLYIANDIVHTGDTDTRIAFGTDKIEFDTAGTHRMTLTSQGQLAIRSTGTTSTSVNLLVYGDADNTDIATFSGGDFNRGLKISTTQNVHNDANVIYDAQDQYGQHIFKTGGTIVGRLEHDQSGFITENVNTGNGDTECAAALQNDYSSWAVIYKNDWIGNNSGWGTFWAGNGGAAYRRVSNDGNPNEHVMVGSGQKRFTFDLDNGNMYYDGSISGTPYDYAEYFEWEDGNPSNEDRRGYSVFVNSNGKIEKATDSTNTSDIIGVISGTAAILGDAAVYDWQGKWKVDEWGTVMRETVKQVSWKDEEGKRHSYDLDKVPSGITIPSHASYRQHTRRILNPDYDETKEYVPRDMRQEWDPVGLLGKVRVRDDSPKNPNWKFIKVVNGKKMWLIR